MSVGSRLLRFSSFWIFPLLAVFLIPLTFRTEPQRPYRDLLWLFPIGVLAWTLLEYGLHRFVFHIQKAIRSPWVRNLVNASHLGHHAAPRDPSKLLVQTWYGVAVSLILFAILYAVSGSLSASAGVLAGIWAGFLYYEATHYRVHFNLSNSPLITWQRKMHFYHHFTNNKRCFGVTSPLWDYVFRTALPRQPR
jgi:sterol desaturase/sphingolipid hydroxylase (fatty acid hydroxylase superfamily)